MAEFAERLVAEGAVFSLIPLGNDIPDQAIFRVYFDLLQAFLAAIFTLGPTRALLQMQGGVGEKSTHRSLAGSHVDGRTEVSFGADGEALAAIGEISLNRGNGANSPTASTRTASTIRVVPVIRHLTGGKPVFPLVPLACRALRWASVWHEKSAAAMPGITARCDSLPQGMCREELRSARAVLEWSVSRALGKEKKRPRD